MPKDKQLLDWCCRHPSRIYCDTSSPASHCTEPDSPTFILWECFSLQTLGAWVSHNLIWHIQCCNRKRMAHLCFSVWRRRPPSHQTRWLGCQTSCPPGQSSLPDGPLCRPNTERKTYQSQFMLLSSHLPKNENRHRTSNVDDGDNIKRVGRPFTTVKCCEISRVTTAVLHQKMKTWNPMLSQQKYRQRLKAYGLDKPTIVANEIKQLNWFNFAFSWWTINSINTTHTFYELLQAPDFGLHPRCRTLIFAPWQWFVHQERTVSSTLSYVQNMTMMRHDISIVSVVCLYSCIE